MKKDLRSRVFANQGFTLVEIAIVLVLIGIILGAVLKGGDLIDNAKEKQFKSEVSTLTTAYYNYLDKYGRIPGDDNTANARWTAVNGDNDGLISGNEALYITKGGAMNHLRYAGFVAGAGTDTTAFISLVYNGVSVGYDSALSLAQFGKKANYLTVAGMSAADMAAYDAKYDDAISSTGDVQSAVPAAYALGTNMIIRLR